MNYNLDAFHLVSTFLKTSGMTFQTLCPLNRRIGCRLLSGLLLVGRLTGVGFISSSAQAEQKRLISTIAGSEVAGFLGDGGPAQFARFNSPTTLVMDVAGNIYISDTGNNRVRKIDLSGIVTTVAGGGTPSGMTEGTFEGDGGPSTQAVLSGPTGLALDSQGNLYIADTNNNRVRKVTPNGIITTIAGGGPPDLHDDFAPATQATLEAPLGLAVDSQDRLLIADSRSYQIRRIETDGTLRRIAGGGGLPDGLDDGISATRAALKPGWIVVDGKDRIWITDSINGRIRRVNEDGLMQTLVGGGAASDDYIPATEAVLTGGGSGLAVDGSGNLVFSDGAALVRGVSPKGTITTLAGGGATLPTEVSVSARDAALKSPRGIVFDKNGNLRVACDHQILKISFDPLPLALPDNSRPVVQYLFLSGDEGVPMRFRLSASDPDGDPLTFSITMPPQHGILTGTPPNLVYTPSPSYYLGDDSFGYQVSDGKSVTDATVQIRVTPSSRIYPTVAAFGPGMQENLAPIIRGKPTIPPDGKIDWTLDGPGDWNPSTGIYTAPATLSEPVDAQLNYHDTLTGQSGTVRLLLRPVIPDFETDFTDAPDSNWAFVNPREGPRPNVTDIPGSLSIFTYPGANLLSISNLNAPRLLRAATGDFEAETFAYPTPKSRARGIGGILLWIDRNNFIRLNYGVNPPNQVMLETQINGVFTTGVSEYQLPTTGVFLKLVRQGNSIASYFHLPNQDWTKMQEVSLSLPPTVLVGIYSMDPELSNDPGPYEESYDSFSLHHLGVNPSGDALFQTDATEAYRGQRIVSTVHFSPQAQGILGGDLTFTPLGEKGLSPQISTITRSPSMTPKTFQADKKGTASFTFASPLSGSWPVANVVLVVPFTPSGESGQAQTVLSIKGQLQTETGTVNVDTTLPVFTIHNQKFGDVNGNGKVEITDALLALRAALGLETLTPQQTFYADVSPFLVSSNGSTSPPTLIVGDGHLNLADVTLILQTAIGLKPAGWPDAD